VGVGEEVAGVGVEERAVAVVGAGHDRVVLGDPVRPDDPGVRVFDPRGRAARVAAHYRAGRGMIRTRRGDVMSRVEQRLGELGIELPAPMKPVGNYVPAVTVDDMVYLSGFGPISPAGDLVVGKVGEGGLGVEAARDAARLTGLQIVAALRAEVGDLDRVRRVVRLFGMVNCAPGFNQTPAVIDGCSDLLVEVFGDAGRGARSAVGMAELPFGIPVEIETTVQLVA
jgi:enamine deaminase RidA (YjgF/YER057c/UK114 family)